MPYLFVYFTIFSSILFVKICRHALIGELTELTEHCIPVLKVDFSRVAYFLFIASLNKVVVPIKPETRRSKPTGREDRSGQEAVITLGELHEKVGTLVDLYKMVQYTNADLNDGIKAVAEASGLLASVVRKFVVATAGGRFDEKKREVEQLALAFDV